jgi:hypothetical protein
LASQSTGRSARGGFRGIVGGLLALFAVEIVADILLFPADFVLVPAEGIIDTVIFVALIVSAIRTRGSGRHIRAR